MDLPESVFGGFAKLVGIEFLRADADRVVLRTDVRPDLLQPHGILHGGVHCTLIETAASVGAALWLGDAGNAVGVANHTNFLHAVREGALTAEATPIHRGRSQQLWLVVVSREDGVAVARGEVRLANLRTTDQLGRGSGKQTA